jgi:L-ribulokinase
MSTPRYAVGADFGTGSCRGVVLRLDDGVEIADHTYAYPGGEAGVITSPADPLVARQHPRDHVTGLCEVLAGAVQAAALADDAFRPEGVVGIGVATTGSTPIPVDGRAVPLALHPAHDRDLDALAWLWKDHTAHDEAEQITAAARATRPEYLTGCGGVYSPEWFWAKAWRCLRAAPHVFDAAASWVELCDLLPAMLVGADDPARVPRSLCAAEHKAMYSQRWGGLPDGAFLTSLDPALGRLRERLFDVALPAGARAGTLTAAWARRTGLCAGTPVAVGAFDAHAAALGAGVAEGVLVKVMGTSTCDITVQPLDRGLADVPGICGVAAESVLPGFAGIEAGQSGVGDMFGWFAEHFVPEAHGATTAERFERLSADAAHLAPGAHGLVALDWINGNRSILVDHRLSGALAGMTLHTRPHHVFQALVESTAFGALRIIERLEEYGVAVREIVASGGLPGRSPLLIQTYANALDRPIRITAGEQTSALGAALLGALAAGAEGGGFATVAEAQERCVRHRDEVARPDPAARDAYRRLYGIYRRLHDALGVPGADGLVAPVMRELFDLRTGAPA